MIHPRVLSTTGTRAGNNQLPAPKPPAPHSRHTHTRAYNAPAEEPGVEVDGPGQEDGAAAGGGGSLGGGGHGLLWVGWLVGCLWEECVGACGERVGQSEGVPA